MKERILYENGFFHIFTRSIGKYIIFRETDDYLRFIEMLKFYKFKEKISFAHYLRNKENMQKEQLENNGEEIVKIISYCLMPTHIHLILTSSFENGITKFMQNLLNSYTRYFNIKMKRKGPLWEGRFKSVEIETDEQLLHLTRYIHLNPVTAYLVDKPENWEFSSYLEYLDKVSPERRISEYKKFLDISPEKYREFVEDRISYQRELAKIKKLVFD